MLKDFHCLFVSFFFFIREGLDKENAISVVVALDLNVSVCDSRGYDCIPHGSAQHNLSLHWFYQVLTFLENLNSGL